MKNMHRELKFAERTGYHAGSQIKTPLDAGLLGWRNVSYLGAVDGVVCSGGLRGPSLRARLLSASTPRSQLVAGPVDRFQRVGYTGRVIRSWV